MTMDLAAPPTPPPGQPEPGSDAVEQRIQELEAELRRLRGETLT